MSAFNTLKKFLKEYDVLYKHSHPNAVLEWFLEKYGDRKNAKIQFDEYSNIAIDDKHVRYIHGRNKYKVSGDKQLIWCLVYRLMLHSANYCEHCRDKRRRFWEEHREIIERLPGSVGKFVMNFPVFAYDTFIDNIVLSDTKLISKGSEDWCINGKRVNIGNLLKEFRKKYDAAKIPKFSEKCWKFADVSVLCRA